MDDITAAYARELQAAVSGIEIRTPEHPADRAQRHRIERMAVWMIAATSAFAALLIVFSLFRLQLVLGGAVGFALKRSP